MSDKKVLRSRILERFPKELLEEIFKIYNMKRVNDNNIKADMMIDKIREFNISIDDELGTGTNRTALFMDGYVVKIALDPWGVRDNEQEFAMTKELQPYVTKVYECNGLMTVSEYVTVMNKEEFVELTPNIREILSDITESYLIGDVGTVPKNFCNWGRRDDGELVILDFAYIYRIIGNELLCKECDDGTVMIYDNNYHELYCPRCRDGQRYQTIHIRRRIDRSMELEELKQDFARAEILDRPKMIIKEEKDDKEQVVKRRFTIDNKLIDLVREEEMKDKIELERSDVEMKQFDDFDFDSYSKDIEKMRNIGITGKTKPIQNINTNNLSEDEKEEVDTYADDIETMRRIFGGNKSSKKQNDNPFKKNRVKVEKPKQEPIKENVVETQEIKKEETVVIQVEVEDKPFNISINKEPCTEELPDTGIKVKSHLNLSSTVGQITLEEVIEVEEVEVVITEPVVVEQEEIIIEKTTVVTDNNEEKETKSLFEILSESDDDDLEDYRVDQDTMTFITTDSIDKAIDEVISDDDDEEIDPDKIKEALENREFKEDNIDYSQYQYDEDELDKELEESLNNDESPLFSMNVEDEEALHDELEKILLEE